MSAAPPPESQEDLTARAAQHFAEAKKAYARGEAAIAATLFEQAAHEVPHAAAFFNAALAWEEAGDRARAADDYDLALDLEQLSPQQEKDARLRLATLAKLLGTLILTEPRGATVQVGHLDKASVPLTVHLAPGNHTVVVTGDQGERSERTISLRAGEVQTLALEPPLIDLPPLATRAPSSLPVAPLSTPRILAWASLGTAAAASGTAIGLGIAALNARAAYEQSGSTSTADYNRASSLRTWTNVSWGIAGVLGGAGLALMFIQPKIPQSTVRVAAGPTSVGFEGQF
jgi:hypothetical protein